MFILLIEDIKYTAWWHLKVQIDGIYISFIKKFNLKLTFFIITLTRHIKFFKHFNSNSKTFFHGNHLSQKQTKKHRGAGR